MHTPPFHSVSNPLLKSTCTLLLTLVFSLLPVGLRSTAWAQPTPTPVSPRTITLEFEPIRDFQHYAQLKSLLTTRLLDYGSLVERSFAVGQVTLTLKVPVDRIPHLEDGSFITALENVELPRLTGRPTPEKLLVRKKSELPPAPEWETIHVSIVE